MSKLLSLKLKEEIFEDVENVVTKLNISRNAYINEALAFYNKLNERKILKNKIQKESLLVRNSSMEVLNEFEKLRDDLPE